MGKIDSGVSLAKCISSGFSTYPVDVVALAESFNIKVKARDIVNCSGFYAAYKNHYCIVINKNQPRRRQRWSLAHEIGHHVMPNTHRTDLMTIEYFSAAESECNAFAAEILMPEYEVMHRLPIFAQNKWTEIADAMADYFDVSVTAALFRLEELGIMDQFSIDDLIRFKAIYNTLNNKHIPEPRRLSAAADIFDFIIDTENEADNNNDDENNKNNEAEL